MESSKLPEGWEYCKLGKYISEVSLRNKSNKVNRVLSVTNNKGFLESEEYFNKQVYSKDLINYKIVMKNQIAYNPSRINVGSIDVLEDFEEGIISPLYVIFSCSNRFIPRYIVYYLKSDIGNAYIRGNTSGSVRETLKFSALCNIKIPVPTLDIQKKIIRVLEKAEKTLEKRKESIKLLDELVKSRFIEMFGNPLRNDKSFETKEGKDLFKISNGKVVPNGKRFDGGIPAYGGNGISWYTNEVLFDRDTIVIGRVGFQSGNVHLAKGPLWITDNAMYISDLYGDKLSLVFLCEMMEQINFTRYQDAGDLKKVTQKPFIEMSYILPPMPLQSEYISFVSQVDKLKFEMQKSLEKMENNFNSLMQRAFKGELSL